MAIFKRRKPDTADAVPNPGPIGEDRWVVRETEFEGSPLIVRVNLGSASFKPTHGVQIGVAVPFNHPQPGGLPTPDEDKLVAGIEDQLIDEVKGRAILTAVLTTGTMREFVLYATEGDWIERFHKDLNHAVATHTIQVVAKEDADWSVFDSLAAD